MIMALQQGVDKVQDGMYTYLGIYLRFNRMEQNNNYKWTAHYRMGEPFEERIGNSESLRGLISNVGMLHYDLGGACHVDGFFDPTE